MSSNHCFQKSDPLSLRAIATLIGGEVVRGDLNLMIHGVATLKEASGTDIASLDQAAYAENANSTRAAACITHERFVHFLPEKLAIIVCKSPYDAFASLSAAFYPSASYDQSHWMEALKPADKRLYAGVHDTALIHPQASLSQGCHIGPYSIVGPHSILAQGVCLGAHVTIGPYTTVGINSTLASGTSASFATIGARVYIKPGARLGQRGFGFAQKNGQVFAVPHIGRVILEDDVEIGANTTIDRGRLHHTIVGQGTKIDNCVQIAHGVHIGSHCFLAAQVGIAGSTSLGDKCQVGGQVGISGHIHLGRGTKIAAKSGVSHSTEEGATIAGIPAGPVSLWYSQIRALRRLIRPLKKEAASSFLVLCFLGKYFL